MSPYAYYRGQKGLPETFGHGGPGHRGISRQETLQHHRYLRAIRPGGKICHQPAHEPWCRDHSPFTTTDYLDDVSKTYVGADKFPKNTDGSASIAELLQDRSYETGDGTPIGIEGRQRGLPKQKDQYIIAEVTFSFNLTSYRCPTAD